MGREFTYLPTILAASGVRRSLLRREEKKTNTKPEET